MYFNLVSLNLYKYKPPQGLLKFLRMSLYLKSVSSVKCFSLTTCEKGNVWILMTSTYCHPNSCAGFQAEWDVGISSSFKYKCALLLLDVDLIIFRTYQILSWAVSSISIPFSFLSLSLSPSISFRDKVGKLLQSDNIIHTIIHNVSC